MEAVTLTNVLLAVVAFCAVWAVRRLTRLSDTVTEIQISLAAMNKDIEYIKKYRPQEVHITETLQTKTV